MLYLAQQEGGKDCCTIQVPAVFIFVISFSTSGTLAIGIVLGASARN